MDAKEKKSGFVNQLLPGMNPDVAFVEAQVIPEFFGDGDLTAALNFGTGHGHLFN
jgi:hypothetical protein